MHEQKVLIVGGSIAGCAIAVLLQRLGLDVVILERSSAKPVGNGAGIMLPESLFKKCIELELFDTNIPYLSPNSRSFNRKNKDNAEEVKFWDQTINAVTLNWVHIYQNLRKRVKQHSYHVNQEVCSVQQTDNRYTVKTSTGETYQADLVIAADGVDSSIRMQLFPNLVSDYTGYVAWRGLIEDESITDKNFKDHVPYYVFPNGHLLLYRIPAKDYLETGNTVLNWLMYEMRTDQSLAKLLIDDKGKKHARSLPPGSLTREHKFYLQQFAQQFLPSSIARIICQTQQPFIQGIFDFELADYAAEHLIFMGDAALTLRPHSGSGTAKALSNAIELTQIIKANWSLPIAKIVMQWKKILKDYAQEELPKAKKMGEALVTHTPEWQIMTQESTTAWWASVMQGKKWYATDKTNDTLFFNHEAEHTEKTNSPDKPPLKSKL